MLPATSTSRTGRRILKRILYSQLALRDAFLILFGKAQPTIPFTVKANPCSVYFNFRIRPECADDFVRYINLADGLSLAPIRCLADEEAELLLTLNIYEVTGIVRGIRAEWSTYIGDSEGRPRYMVLEARSSEYSMDPVDIITKRGRVEHSMSATDVRSLVASNEGQLFRSTVALHENYPRARIAHEWIAANDYIYWRNGICDRSYYDANMIDVPVRIVTSDAVSIDDQTHWARFTQPQPKHVLKYDGPLNFMITPWFNV